MKFKSEDQCHSCDSRDVIETGVEVGPGDWVKKWIRCLDCEIEWTVQYPSDKEVKTNE